MATIKQNVSKLSYELRRGDTFDPTITYKDSTGAVILLSGYTAKMDIKDAIDGNVLLSLTHLAGITLTDTSPNISILIDDSITALFTFENAVYDLELTDTLGVVKTLVEGSILLKKDITL